MHYLIISSVLLLVGLSAFASENVSASEQKVAVFGGGCFWCMEPPFEQLEGVIDVTAGYAGGESVNPTYEQVSSGRTSHIESVRVVYNPEKITALLNKAGFASKDLRFGYFECFANIWCCAGKQ